MHESIKKQQSADDRKKILMIEDEPINRKLLTLALKDDYELVTAETGAEALEAIERLGGELSLALLDLNLPDMNGLDILSKINEADPLSRIPVIVLTADREAEVESLNIGASDFIPKPYPRPEVIRARVRRTIELSEDRIIIGQTEHDELTGLYTREFFYRYAEQYDARHKDTEMDAISININHFHMVNERYGREYANEVLQHIGAKIIAALDDHAGIGCRMEADHFLVYCEHRSDYTDMLEEISAGAAGEEKAGNVVRLRMGVYPKADKTIDIERRFDRAKLAADTVKSTFTKGVAIYDNALHESAIFHEQLLIDFPKAIEEHQFKVYYQPKFDIRGDDPILNSAEALVRWEHPEFGLISPGVFIELFEKNGLIQQMDTFVWKETAAQMRDWHKRFGVSVPVSVNVSRVDMFDPELKETIRSLVKEFGLSQKELLLEVTESAYTEDSDHIIRTVEDFREMGFFIEMDDFGSGYSSLNMLSNLPIDALKLDMQFIRSAFKNGKNTRMLEIVIEIAASLSVPVIAEGVETAEQLLTLKSMGCDIVQGYYFSPPVPPEQFETFILEMKEKKSRREALPARGRLRRLTRDSLTYDAMHDPLTGLYNHSAFDILLYDADRKHSTLLLIDVDNYESIVRNEGGEAAARVMIKIAEVLSDNFRASDFVCRLSEHEFAIILTRVNSSEKELIYERMEKLKGALALSEEGLPETVINFGVAFGDTTEKDRDIFTEADASLRGGTEK